MAAIRAYYMLNTLLHHGWIHLCFSSCTFASGTAESAVAAPVSPWWNLDLAADYNVSKVVIYNRMDAGDSVRIDGAQVGHNSHIYEEMNENQISYHYHKADCVTLN